MLKIILKNLWHRRRANGWLFAELTIVTMVVWYIIDPGVIMLYDTSLPIGYDSERLIKASFGSYSENSTPYDPSADSDEARNNAIDNIYRAILSHPQVESATFIGNNAPINDFSTSVTDFHTGNAAIDTTVHGFSTLEFIPGYKFFETYGIKAAAGSPSPEKLSDTPADGKKIVITESLGQIFWPGENATGKRFLNNSPKEGEDSIWITVAGVVENVRIKDYFHTNTLAFYPHDKNPVTAFNIIIRLKDGADTDAFADNFTTWSADNLKIGNYYISNAVTYDDFRSYVRDKKIGAQKNMLYVLTAFFLVSLMLGTVGTLWLQTRRRTHETGILRSFGARRGQIVSMLMGESAILTTVAFIIGDLLYLQYTLKAGLSTGADNIFPLHPADVWVTHFWPHFLIVSCVVYLLILTCVLIGTWLPAHTLSRIKPMEALREE